MTIVYALFCSSTLFAEFPLNLVSTESDPDAFIQNCVNVINGDYCESATDLIIAGPDALLLQRFYSTKNFNPGIWTTLPERFLVIGKDVSRKRTIALTGERSGGILPYSGQRDANGVSKDPLKIDIYEDTLGLVNTFSKELNGQTNHQNNALYCYGNSCEIVLGDGTRRIYKQVNALPSLLLGEELTSKMSTQVVEPEFFLLVQETLPSGNQLCFSYDALGHLSSIQLYNESKKKLLSWIHFTYNIHNQQAQIFAETSDAKTLTYHFVYQNGVYQLVQMEGSHLLPTSYQYKENLIKKTLPDGRFLEIEYNEGKVSTLKTPHPIDGSAICTHSFSYGRNYTDVVEMGIRSRYFFDEHLQLSSIERYDDLNHLYRRERKFWGKTPLDVGRLLARTIEDAKGQAHSYRSFHYDSAGNILEERLYGNLTGKQEASLQVSAEGQQLNLDAECHIKTFGYSQDGFNLLTKMGDCKGNQTLYFYKPKSNLLIKKLIFDRSNIRKRTFYTYNEDGVCIKTIEDDSTQEEEHRTDGATERHIQEIKPKETLPGVGLPEIILEKAFDLKSKRELLIKKLVNSFDQQSNLISCSTFDANDQYVGIEKRAYNALGQVISKTDHMGREVNCAYDKSGNQISISFPYENRQISTLYNFRNQPIEISEITSEGQFTTQQQYDIQGRKIFSKDRYGNPTHYAYDAFHRLVKVTYPMVPDQEGALISPTFSYTYDLFGNVLTIQDPKGFITTKSYNLRGDPTRINYPDGSFEMFKYDTEGSLHRSLTRDQIVTVYEYDYLGRNVYEESSTTGENGTSSFLKSRSHQYNGFHCTYEREDNYIKRNYYDAAGRLASFVEYDKEKNLHDPESRVTELIYDSLSRLHKKKVWFDTGSEDYALECFEYDLSGNVIEKRIEDAKGAILLQKGFSYNILNQCIEEFTLQDSVKNVLLKTTYNTSGEATSYIDANDQETKILIDYAHLNAFGQSVLKKTVVNPLGIRTELEFDALNRIHSIQKKDFFSILLSSQKILYDPVGNKSCEIHEQIVAGEVVGIQKHRKCYGAMGQLEQEIEALDSPLEQRTHYSYNTLGKMIYKIEGGERTDFTYNKDGRLHKIEAKNNRKELQISNTFSYDRKGNITSAHALHGKVIGRRYNAFNQVVKEFFNDGEGSYDLEYAYDRKGRVKEITLPDRSKIAYIYDAVYGRSVNRISSQGEILYTHTYDEYDVQGKLLKETSIGNVGSHEYKYDLNGQKLESRNDFLDEAYIRDALGRLLEIKGTQSKIFEYNDLSQLTKEKEQSFAYDSLDNCIKVDNSDLIYNALNQLTSYSKAEFSYDIHGNLLKKVLDGEETRFENNQLSQLINIGKPDLHIQFSYDPYGRLLVRKDLDPKSKIKKTIKTSRYLYLGFQEIGSLNESGEIETLKIPGLNGDELALTSIAFEIGSETYVPLHDITGNVSHLIQPQTKQILESYTYSAFGEETIYHSNGEIAKDSPLGNPWRFAEKRVVQQTELVQFGFRFYDPLTARWTSKDPIGSSDGPNLYAYLHNNPINSVDRFGLASETQSTTKFEGYFFNEYESHCYCEKHRTCKRGGDIGQTVSTSLPRIRYCESYEDYHSFYKSDEDFWAAQAHGDDDFHYQFDRSKLFDLGLSELPDELGIGFSNGIDTSFDQAKENADHVSRLSGGYNVHAVYNATHSPARDLVECIIGLNYIATEPVHQLHKMWNNFFERSSPNAMFLMICHSQGAINVRNALLDYPPELRKRIFVVAIAPAAYIYPETCAKAIHYRAKATRDWIPRIDIFGAIRAKGTIFDLDSHPDAPLHDHAFMSPTYKEVLQKHLKNFILN